MAWRTLATLLAVASLAAGQAPSEPWTQGSGGPDRPGATVLPPGPLDVVASGRFLDEGRQLDAFIYFSAGLVGTPTGVLGVDVGGGTCRILRLASPPIRPGTSSDGFPCGQKSPVAAYDPSTGALYACILSPYETPAFRAFDATTFEEMWGVSASDIGGNSAGATVWSCGLPAFEWSERRAIVPFFGGSIRVKIAAIDLDTHDVLWARNIEIAGAYAPATPFGALPLSSLDSGNVGESGLLGGAVTATTAGYAVSAITYCCPFDGVTAWFDRDGNMWGARVAGDQEDVSSEARTAQRVRSVSDWPGASGPLAATVLGNRLVVVNPTSPEPLRSIPIEAVEPLEFAGTLPPVRWAGDTILAPLQHTIIAYDASDLSVRWSWIESMEWYLSDVLVVPPADVLVLAARRTGPRGDFPDDAEAMLFRLSLDSGRVLQRLPLGPALLENEAEKELGNVGREFATERFPARFFPLPDDGGLLVYSRFGDATLLGPAPPNLVPALMVDDAYPALNQRVTVTPQPATGGQVTSFLVSWGDSAPEEIAPGAAARHQYGALGPHLLRVTAVYADGRTATAERVIDVGGTPPQRLNIAQQAFAPENQDITFGLTGLIIGALGALIAIYRQRRHRGRLARELSAVESAYEATKERPLECEASLAERKAHARGLLADGRLDEAQFGVLDRRIDELARVLRVETIDEELGFLSVSMARTLREILSDGRIQRWERDHFMLALERDEHLTHEQKTRVAGLIEAWATKDAGHA